MDDRRMKFSRWASCAVIAGAMIGPVALAQSDGDITAAQAELPRQDLIITGADKVPHVFSVEIAKTSREQAVGEMFRTSIPDNQGMLFVWPYPQISQMWMKNTLVPLDIVFVGLDGKVNAIEENTVPQSLAQIESNGPVKATLELNGGVTAKLGIRVGDSVASKALPLKS